MDYQLNGKNDILSSKLSANKINVATTSQWFSSHNKGLIIPNLLASLRIITDPIYIQYQKELILAQMVDQFQRFKNSGHCISRLKLWHLLHAKYLTSDNFFC